MSNTDEKYYTLQSNKPLQPSKSPKSTNYLQYFKSKRYEHRFYENRRETPRFEKIRTYCQPATDPILNPERERSTGKKVSPMKVELSPIEMYTENPKSNPNLYYFADKVSSLSPGKHNKKNKSANMKNILSDSKEKIDSPQKKSCKKHYSRYFAETYGNNWA